MPAWLLDLFASYGYAVVFAGVFLENIGLPVPGETALLAGAALAHFGQLSLGRVIATAIAAAILGDNLGFFIGRHGGRADRRAARLAHRAHARPAPRVRSVLPAPRAEDGVRRPLHHRPAGRRRGARRRQRDEVAAVPVLQRDGRGGVVHGGRGRGLFAGVQLGDARALDRPQRPGRRSRWSPRLVSSGGCARGGMPHT